VNVAKTALGAIVLPLAACLPCLLVVFGAAGGLALAGAVAAWLTDQAVITMLAAGGAIVIAATAVAYRRRCAERCEADIVIPEKGEPGDAGA
jgi:hypothetical protein